jgi:acyl carrier protein
MEIITEKLTNIMHSVFEDDSIVITSELTAKDVEKWNSISNIILISEVEKTFGFRFPIRDLMALKNVGDLLNVINRHKTI